MTGYLSERWGGFRREVGVKKSNDDDEILDPIGFFFFSGITQRPVLQEKGPPQGRGSYKVQDQYLDDSNVHPLTVRHESPSQ